jgi:hypothetical protein
MVQSNELAIGGPELVVGGVTADAERRVGVLRAR